MLAQTNQRKKDKLLADIHFLIGKGYLTNYILKDNERLIDLSQADDKGEYIASFMNDITIIKCPNCGATCKFPIIYIVVIIVAHYWIKKYYKIVVLFIQHLYI